MTIPQPKYAAIYEHLESLIEREISDGTKGAALREWGKDRDDLLQKLLVSEAQAADLKRQLAEAEALVDKLLAARSANGNYMAGHPVLGGVFRSKNRWSVQINIGGTHFRKHGFLCVEDAEEWRREVSDAIGFDTAYSRMKEDKARMVVRMQEIMAESKRTVPA